MLNKNQIMRKHLLVNNCDKESSILEPICNSLNVGGGGGEVGSLATVNLMYPLGFPEVCNESQLFEIQ